MGSKIAIIGGGPAGLMAAGKAAERGFDTVLFEKNDCLCKKLLITGKGRCNITNSTDIEGLINNIPGNGFFYIPHSIHSPILILLISLRKTV